MRLSKKVWLIAGIAVLAVVLGFLFMTYSQAAAEHGQMEDRLEQARSDLDRLTPQKADLANQDSQARSSLETSQAKFPESVTSIEYGDDLFNIADESNVRITKLTASSPVDRQVGAITYSVSSFVVVVKGDVKDVLDFVHALRTTGDFQLPWSTRVKVVIIAYGSGQATINLDIYGYKR